VGRFGARSAGAMLLEYESEGLELRHEAEQSRRIVLSSPTFGEPFCAFALPPAQEETSSG
jgi:hypothetical protein